MSLLVILFFFPTINMSCRDVIANERCRRQLKQTYQRDIKKFRVDQINSLECPGQLSNTKMPFSVNRHSTGYFIVSAKQHALANHNELAVTYQYMDLSLSK